MTVDLKVLGSSSSGNCGLVVHQGKYYLVDAGFSGKKIREKLTPFGISLEDLSGVFITHEHHDHIVGLKRLSKLKQLKFYANYKTAQAIENRLQLNAHWTIFETNETFTVDKLSIIGFSIPHDAQDPVGYLFTSEEERCVWATDIGHITPQIAQILTQAHKLVLESNHEIQLLWDHPTRPQYLKERIAGPYGHLSNQDVFNFIKNTPHTWKSVCLAHISKDCNSISHMQKLFQPLAQEQKFELEIVDPVFDL